MSNNQLRYIILAGVFLVPFVPLIISSSLFFPYITGKAFVFRLLVEIIFACYLVLAIRDESYRPRFSWILGALIIFLVAIGLADIFAVNPYKAFWSNYERMEGYLTILHLSAFFLVLSSMLKERAVWYKLLATSLGASIIMAIYSFFQLAGKITINQGGVRVDGTLGNASYLGIYMVFHIFFAALLFMKAEKMWQKITLGIVALLDLVVLYFTATRGAILGLLGGVFVIFLFLLWKSERGSVIRKTAVIGTVVLAIFVGLFFTVKNASFVKNSPVLRRFSSLSFAEIKTQGRYYVWPMAWRGFLENPVLGWGQEGFNFVFNKNYNPKMYNQEQWFDRAHSTPLDWLIAGGILGFLSYFFILFAVLFYIFKSKEEDLSGKEKAVILGLISAYFFNNIFVFDQISSYILFFTILAYMHSSVPRTFSPWREKLSIKFRNLISSERSRPTIEALTLVLLLASLYFFVYAPWRQNRSLLNILRLNNEGKIGTLEEYKKPLAGYGMSFAESLEHISQTAMSLASNPKTSAELKQGLFDMVDKAFVRHLSRVPEDARYRFFYGVFLSRFGWYGKAIEQLKEAQKLSPNKQQIYFELSSNLLLDGKINESLQVAKTAFELESSFDEARIIYGLVLIAAGDDLLSEEILKDVPKSKIIMDDRYINVLLARGKISEIIDTAKKRIELEPNNLQHRITLTAAYLQANRRQEAIQILEEIIKLQPSFKEQGEYYINEIKAGRNP